MITKIHTKILENSLLNMLTVDSNINDYWGSVKMLKDIVKPFCLSSIKNKIIMEVGIDQEEL